MIRAKVILGIYHFVYQKTFWHFQIMQKNMLTIEMGRITVELSDELEKKLRYKTIDRFGGKKGDLSRAVEEAVKTWVGKKNNN
ncbi:hypothetical protein A3K80_04910 [Candidatus Bathyarchaeota archaeon RBG_13_38_9]|nr:MAG: hypothetical protein A3K80_04910 [Candidatus Bathyarchaeota archaeon RBG_13_38_9]